VGGLIILKRTLFLSRLWFFSAAADRAEVAVAWR
jgi:hypothetical protein